MPSEATVAADFYSDTEMDLDEPMEHVEAETTDTLELIATVKAAITNLFRLSILIRKVPIEDDYDRATSRYRLPTEWDIRHVRDKFREIDPRKRWLVDRLGHAITRRRAFLRYREEHHQKLSSEVIANVQKSEAAKSLAFTKATTHVPQPGINMAEILEQVGQDTESEGSRTSYAPTVFDEDVSGILNVPRLPASSSYGEPFQCPYCYTIQICRSKHHWK